MLPLRAEFRRAISGVRVKSGKDGAEGEGEREDLEQEGSDGGGGLDGNNW